jgi:hypothetical protein
MPITSTYAYGAVIMKTFAILALIVASFAMLAPMKAYANGETCSIDQPVGVSVNAQVCDVDIL